MISKGKSKAGVSSSDSSDQPSISTSNSNSENKECKSELICDTRELELKEETEAKNRISFVIKVYGTLTAQILLTALIASISLIDGVKAFMLLNKVFLIVVIIASIINLIPIMCDCQFAKRAPMNYTLLFSFTILEGLIIAYLISNTEVWETIAWAVALTIIITAAMTVFACFCTTRLSAICGSLIVTVVALSFFCSLTYVFKIKLNLSYVCIGSLIYGFYLVYDTQLIISSYGFRYSSQDYIFASLSIYIDMIFFFSFLLTVFNRRK